MPNSTPLELDIERAIAAGRRAGLADKSIAAVLLDPRSKTDRGVDAVMAEAAELVALAKMLDTGNRGVEMCDESGTRFVGDVHAAAQTFIRKRLPISQFREQYLELTAAADVHIDTTPRQRTSASESTPLMTSSVGAEMDAWSRAVWQRYQAKAEAA